MDVLKKKRFHFICVALIVGVFTVMAVIATCKSVYVMARSQLTQTLLFAIIPLGWMYEKIKKEKIHEHVSDMMTSWYLGFVLALILLHGIFSIKEQDRLGRELRARMSEEEWEELNDQIKEDARQDYYEFRRP